MRTTLQLPGPTPTCQFLMVRVRVGGWRRRLELCRLDRGTTPACCLVGDAGTTAAPGRHRSLACTVGSSSSYVDATLVPWRVGVVRLYLFVACAFAVSVCALVQCTLRTTMDWGHTTPATASFVKTNTTQAHHRIWGVPGAACGDSGGGLSDCGALLRSGCFWSCSAC